MNSGFTTVQWVNNSIIYEVNLRQYTAAGSFKAFENHIPRLKEMGVDIIWLMPITPISNVGRKGSLGSYYACSSYTKINPEFGTEQDFLSLVQLIHKYEMKVIIDWVANHTGKQHEWMQEHPHWFCKDNNGNFTERNGWEDVVDAIPSLSSYNEHVPFDLRNVSREDALRALGGQFAVDNPTATAYGWNRGITTRDLGFDHLIDELSNALNPQSGLPRNLLLTPQKMQNLGVEGAVQRVHDINAWRAAQKAEADAQRANNAATVLHKGYPENNPLGLRWMELGMPESRARDYFNTADEYRAALSDALKYEGDTMGHCVGGYCDDVLSGRSRIFSLRDAKGQPHVTIEVRPSRGRDKYYTDWVRSQPENIQDEITSAAKIGRAHV